MNDNRLNLNILNKSIFLGETEPNNNKISKSYLPSSPSDLMSSEIHWDYVKELDVLKINLLEFYRFTSDRMKKNNDNHIGLLQEHYFDLSASIGM